MTDDLKLDPLLLIKAKRLGKQRTTRAAVVESLEEYIAQRERMKIVDLFGTIEYCPKYIKEMGWPYWRSAQLRGRTRYWRSYRPRCAKKS